MQKSQKKSIDTIKLLIEFAKQNIPMNYWKSTSIHLQATAGLRSVTPQEAADILTAVREFIGTQPFKFQPEWALTISGRQEGINGWLATNYLLGVFDNLSSSPSSSSSPPQTYGVIEMGGSSTQISFVPDIDWTKSSSDPQITAMKNRLIPVSIAGYSYLLYTHSFLSYGQQAAQSLYQSRLITEIEINGNACYPKGFRHSSIGNFQLCQSLITQYLLEKKRCDHTSCSFNNIYQPLVDHEPFFVIENFYYTLKFFDALDKDTEEIAKHGLKALIEGGGEGNNNNNNNNDNDIGNILLKRLKEKGSEYCSKEWKDIKQQYSKIDEFDLAQYCFAASYQSALLEQGFGLNDKSRLHAVKMIGNKDIDWEIGATLIQILNSNAKNDKDKFIVEPDESMLVVQQQHNNNNNNNKVLIVPEDGAEKNSPVNNDILIPSGILPADSSSCSIASFLLVALIISIAAFYWLIKKQNSRRYHNGVCPPIPMHARV